MALARQKTIDDGHDRMSRSDDSSLRTAPGSQPMVLGSQVSVFCACGTMCGVLDMQHMPHHRSLTLPGAWLRSGIPEIHLIQAGVATYAPGDLSYAIDTSTSHLSLYNVPGVLRLRN
jgi:hypothetical protein